MAGDFKQTATRNLPALYTTNILQISWKSTHRVLMKEFACFSIRYMYRYQYTDYSLLRIVKLNLFVKFLNVIYAVLINSIRLSFQQNMSENSHTQRIKTAKRNIIVMQLLKCALDYES